MRRIRKRLVTAIGIALGATILVGMPASAMSSTGRSDDDGGGSSRVNVPDPKDVVTNEAESVAVGFTPPASGESPCDWELRIEDDLQKSVKFAWGGGFNELHAGYVAQRRQSLSAAARAYSETGRWWVRDCTGTGVFGSALFPEGEAVTVEELILQSIGTLDPPEPVVTVNPEGKQVVQFRSLFWVEPTYWNTVRSDTQTAGRVVSTVELAPTNSVWDPGDGSAPVVCEGPGEVWERGMDGDTFECSHVYKTVAGQPFPFTATVQFDIEVTATVGGVPVPESLGPYEFLERTTEFELGVREIQIVESNA